MRVPDFVRDCVVCIGRDKNSEETEFRATGFFVQVPSVKIPSGHYTHLVTARHVAEKLHGKIFLIQGNSPDGQAIILEGNLPWFYHPDETKWSDVAVLLPSNNMTNLLSNTSIPYSLFLTEEIIEMHKIGAGDEVFISGLFSPLIGNQRNLPIIRTGNVALMPRPDELIRNVSGPNNTRTDMEGYLIEARSIGGLSGSPVFVRGTMYLKHQNPENYDIQLPIHSSIFHLMGLVHGHWDILPEDKNEPNWVPRPHPEKVNLGIAIVTPAKVILETLMHPKLVNIRNQSDDILLARMP